MKKLVLLALYVVLMVSCSSTKGVVQKSESNTSKTVEMRDDNNVAVQNLESNTWKLVELNDSNIAFNSSNSFTISFSIKDNTVSGVGACNRFMGRFERVGSEKIDIKMGASTMMACPNMELEHLFFQMLDEADDFKLDDNIELKLLKNGKECAKFKLFNTDDTNK